MYNKKYINIVLWKISYDIISILVLYIFNTIVLPHVPKKIFIEYSIIYVFIESVISIMFYPFKTFIPIKTATINVFNSDIITLTSPIFIISIILFIIITYLSVKLIKKYTLLSYSWFFYLI